MSATEQYNSRLPQKARLISQLEDWKTCKENPIGEDGEPAPLRAVALHVPNLPADQNPLFSSEVNPKTECAVLADKILRKMQEWANGTSQAGEDLCGDLQPFFGSNSSEGQGHYSIRVKPDRKFFGSETPLIGDLGSPREQASTLVREAITHGRDVMSFAGAQLARTDDRTDRIIQSLEDQLKEARTYIKELESGRRGVMDLENTLADKKLERDLKSRENDMKLRVMESAGNKVLDYIPLFTTKLDQYLLTKFGGASPGQLSDEGQVYKEMAEIIFSKIKDKETAVQVFKSLNLSESEKSKIFTGANKLRLEDKRKTMHTEASAVYRGLGIPQRSFMKLLPPGGRQIPTGTGRGPEPAPEISAQAKVVPSTGTEGK